MLAKRADGMLAHTVDGVGMSIARQCGKTYLLTGLVFGLSIYHPGLLSIWSAHHGKTHGETFIAMQAFAERRKIKPFIKAVYTGSGDEEIRFANGSRILFGARERGFGRGIPGVDVLISDEGQILSQKAMQNMLATLNTSSLGLHIYAGTPPKPEDNSEMWMQMREDALSGESEDLLWIEFGADEDAKYDDVAQYAKANPSFPHRTPIHSIKRLRKRLSEDGFRREALGIYDTNEGSVFDVGRWSSLTDLDVAAPEHVVLMVDVSPDRRWSSIAIAGEAANGRTMVMTQSIKGTQGVVPRIIELRDTRNVDEVAIHGGGTARMLEPDLTQAAIDYVKLSQTDVAAAYSHLQQAVQDGTICHAGQPELAFALTNTKSRMLTSGETESFDRRGQHIDTSPAVAAAGAVYRWGLQDSPMPILM